MRLRWSSWIFLLAACASATPRWAPEKCRRRDSEQARFTICKDEIVEVMKAHAAELQACVEALRLKADAPNAIREVDASFVIKADGTTSEHAITPRALAGSRIQHCVVGILQNLHFPEYLHGTIPVTFPIRVVP